MAPREKGFTLIEVMVVLSILAIIAVLAYSFFGSTIKEAKLSQSATAFYRDCTTLSAAWDAYVVKYGTDPGSGTPTSPNAVMADLVNSGLVKAWPNPDASLDAGTSASPPWTYKLYVSGTLDANGDGTADAICSLLGVTQDFCEEISERYSTLGRTTWVYADHGNTWPQNSGTAFCGYSAAVPGHQPIFISDLR